MFNFSFHLFRFFALRFSCCVTLRYGLYFFFNTTGEYFGSSWYDLLIFEFFEFSNFRFLANFLEFGFSRCSFVFSNFEYFFDFFLWCLRGLNSSFFISFLLKYIKTHFSLNKILLQLTGRLFGCCEDSTTWGAHVSELKTKTRDEISCVKRDILLRRRIIPKIESEARLDTKTKIPISCRERRIHFRRWH